jgi:hypothetical protein
MDIPSPTILALSDRSAADFRSTAGFAIECGFRRVLDENGSKRAEAAFGETNRSAVATRWYRLAAFLTGQSGLMGAY